MASMSRSCVILLSSLGLFMALSAVSFAAQCWQIGMSPCKDQYSMCVGPVEFCIGSVQADLIESCHAAPHGQPGQRMCARGGDPVQCSEFIVCEWDEVVQSCTSLLRFKQTVKKAVLAGDECVGQ